MNHRPVMNMQSILAEHEADSEESWMISYIDVFVLMTTVFVVLMVLHKPVRDVDDGLSSEIISSAMVDDIVVKEPSSSQVMPEQSVVFLETWNKALDEAIVMHDLGDLVQLKHQDDVVELDIASRVLFNSGDAELTRSGEAVLEKLLPVLHGTAGMIYVEGHTDDNPIETQIFPSNWELASTRATEVLKYFVSEGMAKDRFRAVSYGDTKPLVPNTSVQNRKRNRRVSLVIHRDSNQ